MSRPYLIAIIFSVLIALFLNKENLVFEPYLGNLLGREILLTEQIIGSSILLLILALLALIGLTEKSIRFFKNRPKKKPKEMAKIKEG